MRRYNVRKKHAADSDVPRLLKRNDHGLCGENDKYIHIYVYVMRSIVKRRNNKRKIYIKKKYIYIYIYVLCADFYRYFVLTYKKKYIEYNIVIFIFITNYSL